MSITLNNNGRIKNSRRNRKIVLAFFVMSVVLTSSCVWVVKAAPTILRVDPTSTSGNVGDNLSIDVDVANVSNLAGWEFKLYYKRSVVNCTGIVEGPFLRNVGSTFTVFKMNYTYNATYGQILTACALLGLNVSSSGSGVLATVNFKAIGTGDSALDLADTKLAGLGDPPPAIPHTETDGAVQVTSSVVQVAVSPDYVSLPINATFQINITVNYVYDLHYWQCGMSFNPDVLTCVNVTEGTFLKSGGTTVWQQGTIDNVNGSISPFGSALVATVGVSGSGTLEYLTFKVKDAGSSPLTLQDVILLNSTLQKIKPIILLQGSFYLQPTQPTPPLAYFDYYPTTTYANQQITFNASKSDPRGGVITSYNWNFGDNSNGSGMIVNHTFITTGQYNVTLKVTDSEHLFNGYSRIINVQVAPLEYYLDTYTQRGGLGLLRASDSFAPGELILLTAYLAYNGTAKMGKLVTFRLYYPNNTLMVTRVATTDNEGKAFTAISLPDNAVFGMYTANASNAVTGGIVSDTVKFDVGWLIQVLSLQTCNRYGNPQNQFGILEPLYFCITLQNIRFTNESVAMTIAVFDSGYVPIISTNYLLNVPPNQTTVTVYAGLIPLNSRIGQAYAYLDVFQYKGGAPYYPETQCGINIYSPSVDIALVAFSMSSSHTYVGMSVMINVSILNKYYRPESFNLTISANSTVLKRLSIANLQPYTRINFTELWDTYTFSPGNYKITAQASQVPGETNLANNIMSGFVHLTARISTVHDIALIKAQLSKTIICSLNTLYINVTVQNQGDYLDSFDLAVYANNTIIGGRTNISLNAGSSIILTFTCNAAAWGNGKYVISAIALTSVFENDTLDNQINVGTVQVTKPGDVNGDGHVNVLDLITVAISLGSTPTKPNWNCNADIVEDQRINILDLIAVASHLGT